MIKRKAVVNKEVCVACGVCAKTCPRSAIFVWKGCFAKVENERCVGCGLCANQCPASCIMIETKEV